MRDLAMGTISRTRISSTRGKTRWRFAAWDRKRRRVVAVQIFAKPRSKELAFRWSSGLLDCLIKPGLRIRPPAHGCGLGNAQDLARLLEAETGEISQLHQFRLLRRMLAESLQGFIYGEQLVVVQGRSNLDFIHIEAFLAATVPNRLLAPGAVDENAPHGFGGSAKEVSTIFPGGLLITAKTQPGFMNKRGGL